MVDRGHQSRGSFEEHTTVVYPSRRRQGLADSLAKSRVRDQGELLRQTSRKCSHPAMAALSESTPWTSCPAAENLSAKPPRTSPTLTTRLRYFCKKSVSPV